MSGGLLPALFINALALQASGFRIDFVLVWPSRGRPMARVSDPSQLRLAQPRCRAVVMLANDYDGPTPAGNKIDAAAQQALDGIVQEELSKLSHLSPEEQEASLPRLLKRVEERAVSEKGGYQFGDISKAVVESVRGEVQRQIAAEWTMDDISLLLKIGLFLGAGAVAPAAGLAAMPAAMLLATYGTILKAELGVRATQEVGVRLAETATQAVADGVRGYTGKEDYRFGDLTEETVHRITGRDDYTFGDISRSLLRRLRGNGER